MAKCSFCGTALPIERVYRTTLCSSCGKAVKVCLNCKFYMPGAHWDCHEEIPEAVREKDTVNFCDYFQLSGGGDSKRAAKKKDARGNARSSFDNLFGD